MFVSCQPLLQIRKKEKSQTKQKPLGGLVISQQSKGQREGRSAPCLIYLQRPRKQLSKAQPLLNEDPQTHTHTHTHFERLTLSNIMLNTQAGLLHGQVVCPLRRP